MPLLDGLTNEITSYNRSFQELTAQIYEDGFVSCQEATDGTAYYRGVRPRIRRLHRFTRRWLMVVYHRYAARVMLHPEQAERHALIEKGNDKLKAYLERLHDIDKLLTDSSVMLKIFADVLNDCPEDEK